jgi:hypothetical protein
LTGSSIRNPIRDIQAGTAFRASVLSARTPAARETNSSGSPSGIAACVSTGLPNTIKLARPSERRRAAAW